MTVKRKRKTVKRKRKTVKRNNVRQERKMLLCYSLKHLFNLLDLKESGGDIT
jgi:hypothetical protein